MFEIPSAREVYSKLLKEYLISRNIDIGDVDPEILEATHFVTSKRLEIPMGNFTIKISDPTIVEAAKLSNLEEAEENTPEYNAKFDMLLELHGKELVYGWETKPWTDFLLENANTPTEELGFRLDSINDFYAEHLSTLKDDVGTRIYEIVTNRMAEDVYEECVNNMSERDLLTLLAVLNMTEDPAVDFVYHRGKTIMVPHELQGYERTLQDFYMQ